MIVSLPALEWLRSDYTEVWVPRITVPLIQFADRVRAISSTGLDLLELGCGPDALLGDLRAFDSIVSWYGTGREEFRDAVAGLPFEFHAALPKHGDPHAVDFYCRQVGAPLGLSPRVSVPRTQSGLVAIHPYSGSAKKNWPLERFTDLAGRLGAAEFCEGPEEGTHRFPDLGTLAAWLGGAAAYIGNDCGISHLAAAVGCSVVALFGPTDPRVWAPRGENVKVLPLSSTVEEVERAVLEFTRCAS